MDIGMGCRYLLLGIFPTQGSKLHHLHWQLGSLSLGLPGKPLIWYPLVLFTQEYIDELPVLRHTLAQKPHLIVVYARACLGWINSLCKW